MNEQPGDVTPIVLLVLDLSNRQPRPTFVETYDLTNLHLNPYRLIKSWWALPAAARIAMQQDGLTPAAFAAAVLALYRECLAHADREPAEVITGSLLRLGGPFRACVMRTPEAGLAPDRIEHLLAARSLVGSVGA